jgi:hypothetical protein
MARGMEHAYRDRPGGHRKQLMSWAYVERVTRIELALSAWEADVLPLNYTRGRLPGLDGPC